jgi:hypothetical protein
VLNDSDIAMLSEKLSTLQRLKDGILPVFPLLKSHYETEMSRLTASLINFNDEVTRGRIQQLLDILRLPHKLDDEIQNIHRILSQSDDESTTQQGLDGLTGLMRMQ